MKDTWYPSGDQAWAAEGMETSVAEFLVKIPGKFGQSSAWKKGEVGMKLPVHLLPTDSSVDPNPVTGRIYCQ